ncbi:S-layer homology domain-containing protein, partial [Paenibacillus marchantiophytorum]|uniref:S-layer homology domain-containing protein n=1 Tax=Paenibacillus marchantiophytorum TaxID=1619310 RepID=UPI00166F4705
IIEGFEDGSFRPDDTTTRAEVTTILLRYANVEGKKADQYKALNELREVGTTGTNVTSLTPYLYTKNLSGNRPTFSSILDNPITLKNNSGSIKVHHLIIVDSEGDQGSGVYAPMFVDKVPKVFVGQYLVYSDISITSNMEKTDLNTLGNGMPSALISFYRVVGSKVKSYGLNTIPEKNAFNYLVKGEEKRVWVESSIDKNPARSISYSLKVDNGDVVGIGFKK